MITRQSLASLIATSLLLAAAPACVEEELEADAGAADELGYPDDGKADGPLELFDCGPYMATYRVAAPEGSTTAVNGVRCVRFAPERSGAQPSMAWYGEGTWNGQFYRHIGHASPTTGPAAIQWVGSAANIYGNGETHNYRSSGIRMSASTTGIPSWILLQGTWNEVWYLVDQHPSYYPSTLPVKVCGPHLQQFRAYSRSDAPGQGVRCMLEGTSVWYGEGTWGSTRYAHLGMTSLWGQGASDICKSNHFCGTASMGDIAMSSRFYQGVGQGYELGGMWNEMWLPSERRYAVRVHAVRMSNSDGSYLNGITPVEVWAWVERANTVYADADIEFLFIMDEAGPDFETLASTAMNWATGEDDSAWRLVKEFGNAVAAAHPEKMAVFFRRGGGGFSSTGYNFVVMPDFDATALCGRNSNVDLFPHEVGHYLGLDHTFAGAYDTLSAAYDDLKAANGNTAIFDGDRLSDTVPDPFVKTEQCNTDSTIRLGTRDVPIARDNIMSYYDSLQKHLSPMQQIRVKATLVLRGLDN